MSDQLKPDLQPSGRQIIIVLLPDILVSIVSPILLYRLAAPHMPVTFALLLAGTPPIMRLLIGLLRYRRLNPLSILSLLTIALKIFIALVLKESRLLLVSGSLITGVHGVLCLVSLLTPRPLLLWFIEGMLAKAPATSGRQYIQHLLAEVPRSVFTILTAVWGIILLLEVVVNSLLVFTLTIEQFMVISPIVRYGLLGGMLPGTLLFARIRRARSKKNKSGTLDLQEIY